LKEIKEVKTLVEQIIDLLIERREGITVKEICRVLDLHPKMEREVYSSIEKAARALKRKGVEVVMIPPKCKRCGFEVRKPKVSKCPACKSERIEESVFVIR
jgi:hypothetical protein